MTDISAWTAIDDNNLNPSPAGWPESMMPSGVNNSARAMMGSLKRWRDQSQPTVVATGTGNAQVITYPVAPAVLTGGDVFSFYALTNTGPVTLQVNSQAPAAVTHGNNAALIGGELTGPALVTYDGGKFRLLGPPSVVPVSMGGTGSTTAAGAPAAIGAVNKAGDTMSGPLTAPQLTVSGATTLAGGTVNGNFTVTGSAATGSLTITGNATVSGQVSATAIQYPTYGIASPASNIGFVYSYSTAYLWVAPNGAIAGPIAVNISDERLKRDIRPVTVDPLASLERVQLKAFNQIAPGQDGVRARDVGFIAQQLQQIIPDAVIEPPPEMADGYLGLDLMPLVAYCVGAIQQLAARVNELETALIR